MTGRVVTLARVWFGIGQRSPRLIRASVPVVYRTLALMVMIAVQQVVALMHQGASAHSNGRPWRQTACFTVPGLHPAKRYGLADGGAGW